MVAHNGADDSFKAKYTPVRFRPHALKYFNIMNNKHFYKQVCFRLYSEVKDKQDELREAIKQLLPKNELVEVKRGKSIWKVEVVGWEQGKWAGYFNGKSRNGKVHSFFYKDVIL